MRTMQIQSLARRAIGASRRRTKFSRPRPSVMLWPATVLLAGILALTGDAAWPTAAAAARVSGTLLSYQGRPEPRRDLHFENCASHDSYLAPTHSDATFAQNLPPGCYHLRAERGAILRPGILVEDQDVALGAVSELAPFAPARLLDLEALFPTLLTSPAPSTAYIFTHDPTVVPASAAVVKVPSSESEWLKLQKQTEAGTKAPAAAPPPEFNEPMAFTPGAPGGPPPPAMPRP